MFTLGFILHLVKPDGKVHQNYIMQEIKDWFRKNYHLLNITGVDVSINKDCRIWCVYDDKTGRAHIDCPCDARVELEKFGEKFSLNNYFTHMKTEKCTMFKNKKFDLNQRNEANFINRNLPIDSNPPNKHLERII